MHRMLAAHIFQHIRANRCIRIRPMIAAEPRRIDAGQTEYDLAVWTAALVFRLVACCIQSMSRKGNYYDNSVMETFFGKLKTEIYYGFEKEYSSFNTFVVAIEEYINYYNNRRIKKKSEPPVKRVVCSRAISP